MEICKCGLLKCHSRQGVLPEISKPEYIKWYNIFIKYLNEHTVAEFSEDVVLNFFECCKNELKYNHNSMYAIFSGIKSTSHTVLRKDMDQYFLCKK